MITIEGDGEDTASVKKMFLKEDKTSDRVSEDLHILDSWDYFVGMEVDMLMEWNFPVKDKTKVLPSVFGLQDCSANVQ